MQPPGDRVSYLVSVFQQMQQSIRISSLVNKCFTINGSLFSVFTDAAEGGINCYSGLTVTNTESGEVVFNHEESQLCKVSDFCQVITYTVTKTGTQEASK